MQNRLTTKDAEEHEGSYETRELGAFILRLISVVFAVAFAFALPKKGLLRVTSVPPRLRGDILLLAPLRCASVVIFGFRLCEAAP